MKTTRSKSSIQAGWDVVLLISIATLLQPSLGSCQTLGTPEAWSAPLRLKAMAVDLLNGAPGGNSFPSTPSDLVQIVIERWSTDVESVKISDALRLGVSDVVRVLDSVRPRVGYVRYLRSDDSMPPEDRQFPLAYATRRVTQDGKVQVVIATSKQPYPNAAESPVKVIEMRFGTDGIGEGRIAAAKIGMRGGQPVLELSDYTAARRCLKMIRKE